MNDKEQVRAEIDAEKRMILWQWGLDQGWVTISRHNCLYSEQYSRRLNFRHDRLLRLEEKQPLTVEERKKRPKKSNWVVLKKQSYGKVMIEDGVLNWMEKKKGAK